jgi:hypothetical protein
MRITVWMALLSPCVAASSAQAGDTSPTGKSPGAAHWSADVVKEISDKHPEIRIEKDHLSHEEPGWRVRIEADGRVEIENRLESAMTPWGIRFGFPTNRDHYHEKKAFLKRTFEFRARLARLSRAKDLRLALDELWGRLEAIWTDRTLPAARRKREIFMEWQDTNNDPDAGLIARRIVERFIAKKLAHGGPNAFTDEEIARYNAGHRRQFNPYGVAEVRIAKAGVWWE